MWGLWRRNWQWGLYLLQCHRLSPANHHSVNSSEFWYRVTLYAVTYGSDKILTFICRIIYPKFGGSILFRNVGNHIPYYIRCNDLNLYTSSCTANRICQSIAGVVDYDGTSPAAILYAKRRGRGSARWQITDFSGVLTTSAAMLRIRRGKLKLSGVHVNIDVDDRFLKVPKEHTAFIFRVIRNIGKYLQD